MNSKTSLILAVIAVAFAFLFSTSPAFAEAVNLDDPNLALRAEGEIMNAQFVGRGITCETGTCFKDTVPAIGFDTTPLIEPPNTGAAPAKPTKSKASPTVE